MKKLVLFLSILCASTFLQAQTMPRSNFFEGYTAGEFLEKSNAIANGAVVLDQWRRAGRPADTLGINPSVEAPLVYTNYIKSNTDVSARLFSNNLGTRASVYGLVSTGSYISSGTFYCGMMVKVNDASTTATDIFSFVQDANGSTYRLRLTVQKSGGDQTKFRFGLVPNKDTGSSATTNIPTLYPIGSDTYLVVLKVTFDGNDPVQTGDVSLFINPTNTPTEPAANPVVDASKTTTHLKYLRGIALRESNGVDVNIGGIIIANSWTDLWTTTPTSQSIFSQAEKEIESVRYFNLNGSEIKNPENKGVYIERSKYKDGEVVNKKIINKY